MLKKLLIDFVFIVVYVICYIFLGFEITIVIALAQIASILFKNRHPKKSQPLKSVYIQPKTRMKF